MGQFKRPQSIAVSAADEVFVVDPGNFRIQVFGLDGSYVRSWGSRGEAPGQFELPAGVAVHGNLVLVSDMCNHCIQCFGLDGTFVRMWGSKGAAPGQFVAPAGVAVSSAGEVFVCDPGDHRVKVFGLDGTFRRSWGSKGMGPGEFLHPVRVTVSSAGEVLVQDIRTVQVFAANGSYIRHVPVSFRLGDEQHDVAVDDDVVDDDDQEEEEEEEEEEEADPPGDDVDVAGGDDPAETDAAAVDGHDLAYLLTFAVAVTTSGDVHVLDGNKCTIYVEPAGA